MQHPFDRRRKNNIATRKRYAERKNDQEFRLTQAFNKRRAISAAQGIPFDIERSDLVYTGICPVLGIEIYYGGPHETTPSIDKIIPSLGYVKGNVRVISQRANRLKSDMSFEECKKLLDNFYKV